MMKIPVDVRWKILEPSTRGAARGVYRSARRAGYSVNDSRYMVNSIIDGYFDQDESQLCRRFKAGGHYVSDEALENWDDEPRWIKSIAGLGEHRSQLENIILIFCGLVIVYVVLHVLWALS